MRSFPIEQITLTQIFPLYTYIRVKVVCTDSYNIFNQLNEKSTISLMKRKICLLTITKRT